MSTIERFITIFLYKLHLFLNDELIHYEERRTFKQKPNKPAVQGSYFVAYYSQDSPKNKLFFIHNIMFLAIIT